MAKPLFYVLLLLLIAAPGLELKARSLAPPAAFYDKTEVFFKGVVREGLVDYGMAARNKGNLQELLQLVATADLKGASAREKKAFYINAYNLLVVGAVLERYPLPSVKEVPGFFDKQTFSVAGERLTLNELENQKLREPYQDPRIHFVLVCAARGCPPLLAGAFRPEAVEQQLTDQTRQTLSSGAFIRVQQAKKQVLVSEIFKWYAADFPQDQQGLIGFLNTYRGSPIPNNFKIDYYPYDWALNEARRR